MPRKSTTLFRSARSSSPCPIVGFSLLGVTRLVALGSLFRYIREDLRTERIFDLLRARELASMPGGCAR